MRTWNGETIRQTKNEIGGFLYLFGNVGIFQTIEMRPNTPQHRHRCNRQTDRRVALASRDDHRSIPRELMTFSSSFLHEGVTVNLLWSVHSTIDHQSLGLLSIFVRKELWGRSTSLAWLNWGNRSNSSWTVSVVFLRHVSNCAYRYDWFCRSSNIERVHDEQCP